jgi:hypothetical protein
MTPSTWVWPVSKKKRQMNSARERTHAPDISSAIFSLGKRGVRRTRAIGCPLHVAYTN